MENVEHYIWYKFGSIDSLCLLSEDINILIFRDIIRINNSR